MANDFNKEERVAFEELLEGFTDALILSKACAVYRTDQQMMQRTNDIIWRPQPYIMSSIDGFPRTDISGSYQDANQLSVPATIGFNKTVPWTMDALELREALNEGRLGDAAKQRLASDINIALLNVAAIQGTLVVKHTAAASSFDDIAEAEAVMNEQGVMGWDRYIALNTRDYNGLAGDLAGRENLQARKTLTAYERAYVGMVSSFDTFKMDYSQTLSAATATGVVINGAGQYYTPRATDATQLGKINVDNRYQDIALTVGANTVAVGDCFTIAGVNSVHHITKEDTGQLKTFRVIDLLSSGGATGTMRISPPIISGGGGTDAELQYQNVTATPANGAALTFLNTVTAQVNPFWYKDSLEILPGRLQIDASAGPAVMRGSTEQGIEIVMQKSWDTNTNVNNYRVDCLFGVVNKQPEMTGIMLFNQT